MSKNHCPRCGGTNIGVRWAAGRMLQQYCRDEDSCGWVGAPYTPPRRGISCIRHLRVDEFCGWSYTVYDKFGHVYIESEVYHTQQDAIRDMTSDIMHKRGDDPAAPYTAVLFNVPSKVSIVGTKYRYRKGLVKV